jgi:hypothetical protein
MQQTIIVVGSGLIGMMIATGGGAPPRSSRAS